ncbi:MAG: hypothetical protein H7831_08240 [Magnetococcus sp. WYHC-3]
MNSLSALISPYRRFKAFWFALLEDQTYPSRAWVNLLLTTMVLASLTVMILEEDPFLSESKRSYYAELDRVFLAMFLVEYLLRWWLCTDLTVDFL